MKRALVTGGSRGIGKAIVQLLEERGFAVSYPTHSELDLESVESIEAFVEKNAEETFDVVVNNAGLNEIHSVDQITEDELTRMMQVNLMAPIRLLRGLVPNMKKQKYGRIVNIGSIWGLVSKEGRTVYSATKHGVHGLTQTLAVELAPYNILVNTICPGFTLTELTSKNNTPVQIEEISSFIPMQRMAQPIEIAKAVVFLVGEDNTYITGQQLAVDGGYTAK